MNIKKIFFWRKNGNSDIPKAEEMLALYIKYIPLIRKAMDDANAASHTGGEFIKRMYDFWAGYHNGDDDDNTAWTRIEDTKALPSDSREERTPLSVASELERIPISFDLTNLDAKIMLFKSKTKLISQRFTRDQVNGFITRLENRKHYEEHKEFFESFPNTNDDKIDNLISKYKLVLKKSDLFVPTFPKEAIDIMSAYSEKVKKFTDEAPVFYVIAEEKDFEKKYKKLDPILLVQSPFGFFWQILGAWDKEMLLLSEL